MKLDRASITGHAFSTAADGYDRTEVDAHLRALADAAEAAGPQPVGQEASERLKEIVEGVEESTAALRQTAEQEAEAILSSARAEAKATREKSLSEAETQLAQARAAVRGILERVDGLGIGVAEAQDTIKAAAEQMAQRLQEGGEPVVGALRDRADALGAELDLMGAGVLGARATPPGESAPAPAEPAAASGPVATTEPTAAAGSAAGGSAAALEGSAATGSAGESVRRSPAGSEQLPADEAAAVADDGTPGEDAAESSEPVPAPVAGGSGVAEAGTGLAPGDLDEIADQLEDAAPEPEPETVSEPEPDEPEHPAKDREKARLTALNMALSGTRREDAEANLRERFGPEGLEEILDEVYAHAGQSG